VDDNLLPKRAVTESSPGPAALAAKSSFVKPSATELREDGGQPYATERTTQRNTDSPAHLSATLPALTPPTRMAQHPQHPTANRLKSTQAMPYRSPISGKIVMGTPTAGSTSMADPHLMPPLPGQAPERPLILVIERGSYMLRWPGEAPQRVRLTFNAHITEQEALYDTLIGVLETVEQRLRDGKADPKTARLDMRSADLLFVQQLRDEIPCEDILLQVRRNHALKLLDHFQEWRVVHQT
jgi:hypothetical protein